MSSDIADVRKVHVELGPTSYDVLIGRNLLSRVPEILHNYQIKAPYALVADAGLRKWAEQLQANLRGAPLLSVPAGESSKSLAQAETLMREFARQKLPRAGAIV